MIGILCRVSRELKTHAPFTIFGAVAGIALVWAVMAFNVPRSVSENLFWVFHPLHVFLSAFTTAAMLRLHRKSGFLLVVAIGYAGSIGIATLSDSLIPFLAEWLLDLPHRDLHIGCAEKWWLVNPAAATGIIAAYLRPSTKLPHAGHVFLSTGASLFHIAMALGETLGIAGYFLIATFLFLAVWVPCCTSDIIFPMFFSREEDGGRQQCC